MRIEELFPLGSGLALGALLGLLRPSMRLLVGIPLAVTLGVLATIVSGEFRVSWAYLLVDIPIVAVAAVVGLLAVRQLRPAATES